MLIPLAVAAVVALQSVLVSLVDAFSGPRPWGIDPLRTYGPTMCALCLGFGLLGMLDDLGGVGESGGFRGHLSALAQGRLTTGAIKAFGGPLLALALLGSSLENGRFGVIREAALISLAANLGNLLDRAPGRSIKISALGAAIFVAAIGFRGAAIVGPPAGASLVLLHGRLPASQRVRAARTPDRLGGALPGPPLGQAPALLRVGGIAADAGEPRDVSPSGFTSASPFSPSRSVLSAPRLSSTITWLA